MHLSARALIADLRAAQHRGGGQLASRQTVCCPEGLLKGLSVRRADEQRGACVASCWGDGRAQVQMDKFAL
jgi:hypothetical protein